MTGGCTCPIYYQGVVRVEKGCVIIGYKLAELIKKIWRGTPPPRSHVSSITMVESRNLLSRSHVSSMTMVGSRTLLSRSHVSTTAGGCTYPTYYQRVVSADKGSVIIRYKNKFAYQKMFLRHGTPLSRGHVSGMTGAGSRTLLSRSHVSSMTRGWTCPIHYQGVVTLEKVIIRYKLPELIKTVAGTPISRSHVSSMTMVGSRSLLSRSHVSSMTGGWTCPIYYQGVVSVAKRSVIIRYQPAELIKRVSQAALSCSHVSSMTVAGSRTLTLPQTRFKHDGRVYLSDILPGSCQCRKKKCGDSLQIS